MQSAKVSVRSLPESSAFVQLISKLVGCISRQLACEISYFKVNEEYVLI